MPRRAGELLIVTARLIFLALLIFSAADYGLTRDSGIVAFNWGMGCTCGFWLIGHFLCWRLPKTGWFLPAVCAAILLLGWSVTFLSWLQAWCEDNNGSEWAYDIALKYGAYYLDFALAAMFRTTILLGAFLMAVDLFRDRYWGKCVLIVLCATAIGIVAFFFLQKLTGNALVLVAIDHVTPLSFATYRYWGNAASFLNLLWPLLAAVAIHTGIQQSKGWSLWMAASIMVFSALYINLSKAGHVLGLVGLVVFGLITGFILVRSRRASRISVSGKYAAAAAFGAIALGAILFSAIQKGRWDYLFEQGIQKNERTAAYRDFAKMLPDAGWTGLGPGSFQRAHISYIKEDPVANSAPFWVAHQDYMQTVVEWGYAGTILWAILFVPATFRLLFCSLRRNKHPRDASDGYYAFTWTDKIRRFVEKMPGADAPLVQAAAFTSVLLTSLHAMVDFPMQIESLQFYFLTWIALGWQKRDFKQSADTDND